MSENVALDNHWQFDAACRGRWPLFDSVDDEDGKSLYPHLDEAKKVCSLCPVLAQCRIAGEDEPQGIWAGEVKGVRRKR